MGVGDRVDGTPVGITDGYLQPRIIDATARIIPATARIIAATARIIAATVRIIAAVSGMQRCIVRDQPNEGTDHAER